MRSKLDLTNCLTILRACEKRPRTAKELLYLTGMSPATLYRTLLDLREQIRADIPCEDGRYAVADWGIIDSSKVSRN